MTDTKISSQYQKLVVLLFGLILVKTVATGSINVPSKTFRNWLIKTALMSLNEYSSLNHIYQKGELVNADYQQKRISETYRIWNVSVIVDSCCYPEGSSCPREICTMYIRQNKQNNLIVDDQSKQCKSTEQQQSVKAKKKPKEKEESPGDSTIIFFDDPKIDWRFLLN